jgi:biotin carboxyl carrier protein
MKKNVKVIVNGKAYDVEVEDLGGGQANVSVNGTAYQVSVESGNAPEVAAVKQAVPNRVEAPAARPSPRPAVATTGNVYSAPMPGVILDVAVKPGDHVVYGQQLCALEAMKMKNAIRAPRDGVVASVEVQEGQKVAYGDVLFRFE